MSQKQPTIPTLLSFLPIFFFFFLVVVCVARDILFNHTSHPSTSYHFFLRGHIFWTPINLFKTFILFHKYRLNIFLCNHILLLNFIFQQCLYFIAFYRQFLTFNFACLLSSLHFGLIVMYQ